ncbi:MAG: LysE family transporter [Ignavibacteriae bacterium]|nr:LysE family transporter [Ignavibacteriota bacterium]
MTESFLVIFFLGLFAGFFFSVPIAGPISILITSSALKGNSRYCIRTSLGGAIVEAVYVFIAIYGLTSLYSYYQKVIPIILIIGSIFLLFVAYKIIKTKIKLEQLSNEPSLKSKYNSPTGGFRTGIILNLSNPSLFLGWFTSSFLLLSFASSVGLNTGGLDLLMYDNVTSIEEITGNKIESLDEFEFLQNENSETANKESLSSFILSMTYAVMVGIGSFIWFYLLTKFLIKHRDKLNIDLLNGLIKILGIFLFGIGFYLIYEGMYSIFSFY